MEPSALHPDSQRAADPRDRLDVADGVERALDPRSVVLARVQSLIFNSVLATATAIAVGVSALQDELPRVLRVGLPVAWLALIAFLFAWGFFWPALSYKYARFRVDEDGIHIRRGVLFRSAVSVPRSRVQHTDVAQGPVERWVGLARLVIHTAGTHHASVTLGGLAESTASAIRDHLIEAGDGDAV